MHYQFSLDLSDGQAYERYLTNRFTRLRIPSRPNPFTAYELRKAFDILVGHAMCECKLDIMARETGNLCFETDLLYTPSDFIIYGTPTYRYIYSHVFTRLDIWRMAASYPIKYVGDYKRTECIIVPKAEAFKWGYPLTTLEEELCKTLTNTSLSLAGQPMWSQKLPVDERLSLQASSRR